jgi:hypothetical protein
MQSMRGCAVIMPGADVLLICSSPAAALPSSMHHPNRFVREAAHGTCCAVSVALTTGADSPGGPAEEGAAGGAGSPGQQEEQEGPFSLQQLGHELAPLLADGLTDSWSQVGCVRAD